ncbi:MAG: cytochrome D ubiquinol oxidase subunit I, partial [Solirubrobacteraceae bacterium]
QLGQVVEASCDLAQALAGRVAGEPALELLAPVALNIVCFRYVAAEPGSDLDQLNAAIVADLQEAGIAAPSTTSLGGRLAIRAALVNHRTTTEDIDALVEAVLRIGAERVTAAA